MTASAVCQSIAVIVRNSQSGSLFTFKARHAGGYTLSEIAAHLDIHYTTVSKVVNENSENRYFKT